MFWGFQRQLLIRVLDRPRALGFFWEFGFEFKVSANYSDVLILGRSFRVRVFPFERVFTEEKLGF